MTHEQVSICAEQPQQDIQDDPLDLFDTALSTIFSIPPIAFSSGGTFTYHPPLSASSSKKPLPTVKLTLPSPPAELYTTLQANHVWLASVYLADQLASGTIPVEGKRVAELGAGAGLPGIIACLSGARGVVSSDWDTPDVLGAIKRNFTAACEGESGWAVTGHTWGTDPSPLLTALSPHDALQRFDTLLLADTLWVTDAHSVLLDSMFALLDLNGTAYIAAGLHTGRGPVERFRSAAKGRGAHVSPIINKRWLGSGGWGDNQISGPGLEEERGVVVYFTLRLGLLA